MKHLQLIIITALLVGCARSPIKLDNQVQTRVPETARSQTGPSPSAIIIQTESAADTSVPETITAVSPSPTPGAEGSRIAFSSNRDGNYEIYIMNSDGSNQKRLTHSPADDWFPALSEDGEWMLYWSFSTDPPLARLYWMKADGSEQGVFADNVGPNVDVSSVGLAAFESYADSGTRDIVGMAGGGGEMKQLTDHPSDDIDPSWSPDGETIAFVSYRADGETPYIYLMDWDGSNQRRLTHHDVGELEPDWSPDGSMLVFMSVDEDDEFSNIFIVNADGTNLRQLTNEVDNYNENPVWSPDGTRIAFWSNKTGNKEIYSIGVDGTGLTNLTNSPADDENPSWSKVSP